ncbi:LytR/AlgR family response regulator transcription factor [Bifidobacterium oedipodis]|uniref:Response regulator of the LytR/AlgR family n=1 Tax=Bifidobacterium oedipodis TaxID=2675322 RepID=A0A7Y0HUK0_9BIFI|nr:LytTR family DNA-binding domain-containing protein [Bifidobacterium sp. DSM 109957]NMM94834.1 response regulator of the LytR/AlgR family [Bifidobacterium sp. DSM 109957]
MTTVEKLSVAVVDDEQSIRASLVELLHRYEQEHPAVFTICEYSSGEELLRGYRCEFDLVLMDVMMGGADGFDIAHGLRQYDRQTSLVFVTSISQMAIRGYEVGAQSYLLKPVSYFALEHELDRCVAAKRRSQTDMLTMSVAGGVARVPLGDIQYLESGKGHKVIVHAFDATYEFVGTLKSFKEQLEDRGFASCNACYLVNMRHVTSVQRDNCDVRGGVSLGISRRCKTPFIQALADFVA